jgi:starvation-inducible DNA-binding protein
MNEYIDVPLDETVMPIEEMHEIKPEQSGMDLAILLARAVADSTVAANIAHGYHWNVMGPDFNEYHEFFGEIYEDIDASIDDTAESILKLGHEAPYLLTDFLELTSIHEERIDGGNTIAMLESLHRVNGILIGKFNEIFAVANDINRQDIANYAADRLTALQKHAWQIKASLGIR